MGRVKQESIDNELLELPEVPPIRVYTMNGSYLTREAFISQVALSLYINEPNTDIRKTIDLLLEDDMKELICSGGDTFFSYIDSEEKHPNLNNLDGYIIGIDMGSENRPLKSYKVSYDILVVPTIPILQRRKTYKRAEETVQATSFREAKAMVKEKLTGLGKVTKSFAVELINTEAGI